jgi:ribosomal protein L17
MRTGCRLPILELPDGTRLSAPDGADPRKVVAGYKAHLAASPPKKTSSDISESPTSAMNLVGAAVEPMMSMASGAVAQPIAGLAGIGAAGTNAMGITNTPAADVVNKVQGSMTYQPRTTGGQNAMSAFTSIPQALEEGITRDTPGYHAAQRSRMPGAGNRPSGDWSPAAKTVGTTLTQGALQLAGAKGGAKMAETPGVLKPKGPSPSVKMLADKGVTMTPGQIKGGATNAIEQKLTSLPIIGDVIKSARGKSVEQFSQATVQDALTDIGETLPKSLKGHDAVAHAGEKFNEAYDKILPKLKGDLTAGTQPLGIELNNIKSMSVQALPAEQGAAVARFIDQDIIAKFKNGTTASGAELQEIRENLRHEIESYQKSNVPADRKVALALITAREAMDKMIEQVNPKYAAEYAKIRSGYAKFSIAEAASSLKGAKEGVATPSQYTGAVRAKDASKNKRRFAQGRANQQPLAKAGSKVLAGDEPDSGTAGRVGMASLVTGGAGAAAALHNPLFLAGGAILPAMYSQMGLKALQPFLMRGKNKPAVGTGAALGLGTTQPGSVDENGVGQ